MGGALYSMKPPKQSPQQMIGADSAGDEGKPLTSPVGGEKTEPTNGHGPPDGTNRHSSHPEDKESSAASLPNDVSRVSPRVYKRRWIMLFLFTSYSLTNAYQWIHLNIIGNVIMKYYNSSLPESPYHKQVTIDWLSMVYMLAYIPLIFPVTWLLDRRGLRIVGLVATFLNATGAWIKCTAVHPDRFILVMFAQTLCAIGQVFILGMPARLAAVWFGHNQVSTATAIGVFGNQLGCAFGFLIPPLIVPDSDSLSEIGQNLSYMFYGSAAITTFQFILVMFVFKAAPPVPPSQAQAAAVALAAQEKYWASLKRLFHNKGFILLMLTYGINTGSYYAIGTLLNPVILYYFPGHQENAGWIGVTLVVSGVFGSIIAGLWLDRTKLFKSTTVGIYFMSFIGMIMFTFTLGLGKIWIGFLCSGILGFFMTGYLPVGFEFAAEITYPESEGTSSGLLNASAQLFGITLTLGMGALMNTYGNLSANIAVSSALFVGTIGTALIRSDLRRQKAGLELCKREIQISLPEDLNNQSNGSDKLLCDGEADCKNTQDTALT